MSIQPKYLICPGWVTSKTDGQRHHVGHRTLIMLYGVDPRECVIYSPQDWWDKAEYMESEERYAGLQRLGPSTRDCGSSIESKGN